MGEKIYGNGILDAETRKKDEEKAFLAQVENFPHITEIQRIMQNYLHFWRKKICIPLRWQTILQSFMCLIIKSSWCNFAFLRFCKRKCMYGQQPYIYIIILLNIFNN